MSAQSEALRLADRLDLWGDQGDLLEAAAELRRLSAENESLRQIVQDFPPVEAELREVSDRAHRLKAQRDALLEALKLARLMLIAHGEKHAKFDAAIAKAEEKT